MLTTAARTMALWVFSLLEQFEEYEEPAGIIESNLHTHSILPAFWWENREGSASLPMWRSYILNQIHVCFMCVCVCLPSSGYRLAPVAPQHTKYLPFSFVTKLLWSPTILQNKIKNAVRLKINYLAALCCKMHVIMIFTFISRAEPQL